MIHTYSMTGDGPDPINSGTMCSWFYFYKWFPDGDGGEVFVPSPPGQFPDIGPGDTLLFVMDGEEVGYVTINKIQMDVLNGNKELWYDTATCTPWAAGNERSNSAR